MTVKKMEVEDLDDLDNVLKIVRAQLEINGKQLVTTQKFKLDRSAEQNALMWKWLTVIGNELGNTKDEMHEIYKEKYLISIFVRDDPGYAAMAAAIKQLRYQSNTDYQDIRKQVIKMTSTTKCNVKQMREYLTDIKQHASSELNITLPLPELRGLI